MSKEKSADQGRRSFLKVLGVAGGGAALAPVAGGARAASAESPQEQPAEEGYRKTGHVHSYYESCRI